MSRKYERRHMFEKRMLDPYDKVMTWRLRNLFRRMPGAAYPRRFGGEGVTTTSGRVRLGICVLTEI